MHQCRRRKPLEQLLQPALTGLVCNRLNCPLGRAIGDDVRLVAARFLSVMAELVSCVDFERLVAFDAEGGEVYSFPPPEVHVNCWDVIFGAPAHWMLWETMARRRT